MAEIGIQITADDAASKTIKKIGVGVDNARAALAKAGETGKKAFDLLGAGAVVLNQTLELGRKAFDLLKFAIGDTITKALEFRRANDPAVKFFETAKRGAELITARLGDVLIPIIMGVARSFGDVTGSVADWIAENRKLIAGKIIENLREISLLLTGGIAKGAAFVTKVWLGWKLVIDATKLVVNIFFEGLLSLLAKVAGGIGRLAGIFDKDLGASILSVQTDLQGMGDEFELSGDQALASMEATAAAIKETEDAIKRFESAAVKGINAAAAAADRAVEKSITGMTRTREEETAAAEARIAASIARLDNEKALQDQLNAIAETNLARRIELTNKAAAEEDAIRQRNLALASSSATQLTSIGANLLAARLAGAEAGEEAEKAAAKAVLLLTLDVVKKIILAKAAEAAAKQAAAQSSSIIGLVLAPAAAAAMFALISAFVNRFEHGGLVTGGVRGRDSVPALLTPGEVVIPAPVVQQFSRRSPRQFSSGGVVMAQRGGMIEGGGFTGPSINLTISSLVPPTTAEATRAARSFGKTLTKLQRRGMFKVR